MGRSVGALANNGAAYDAGAYEASAATNAAPVFSSSPDLSQSYKVGEVFSYNITVTDADGDTITITAQTKPTWATFTDNGDGTATISGTVVGRGDQQFTIRASDGTDNTDQSFSIHTFFQNVFRNTKGALQPGEGGSRVTSQDFYRYKGAVQPLTDWFLGGGLAGSMDLVSDLVYDLVQDLVG